MKRTLIWGAWLLVAAVLLLVGTWLLSRMRGPSSPQTAAMALLQQRPPTAPGGNAFAAIWLLPFKVPDARLQALAEADFALGTSVVTPAGYGMDVPWVHKGLEPFETLFPSPADKALVCEASEADCLDRVRSDPVAYDGLIERNQVLLDRIVALQAYGYYRSPESAAPEEVLWSPSHFANYDLTRIAWQFSRGETDAALVGACDGAGSWRQLAAHSDSRTTRMTGSKHFEGYASLLARMLQELPLSYDMPASCVLAFAPASVADASICEAMRGEFSAFTRHLRGTGSPTGVYPRRFGSTVQHNTLVFDSEKTLGVFAAGNAWACSETTKTALQNDVRVHPSREGESLWRLDCVANVAGCVLSDRAFPAFYQLQWSAQDHAARLDLIAALLWLHNNGNPEKSRQLQLLDYWSAHHPGDREIRFENEGRVVALELYESTRHWWSVPFSPDVK